MTISNIQKYFKKESEGPVNKGGEATYSAETGSVDEGEKDMSIEDSVNEPYSINESPLQHSTLGITTFYLCIDLACVNCSYSIQY